MRMRRDTFIVANIVLSHVLTIFEKDYAPLINVYRKTKVALLLSSSRMFYMLFLSLRRLL